MAVPLLFGVMLRLTAYSIRLPCSVDMSSQCIEDIRKVLSAFLVASVSLSFCRFLPINSMSSIHNVYDSQRLG